MRKLAVEILCEIKDENSNSTNLLNKNTKNISDLDSKFLREIVYGTLENRIYLDYIIKKLCKLRIKKFNPYILNILRVSIYQIIFMDKIPEFAIINEAVNLTKVFKLKKFSSFVNGSLRNFLRNKEDFMKIEVESEEETISIKYSANMDIVKILLSDYGREETIKILENSMSKPHFAIRISSFEKTEEKVVKDLKKDGYNLKKSEISKLTYFVENPTNILETESFKRGDFTVQDVGSILTGEILAPKKNSKVLDICSAPGGKTCHLAFQMKNTGEIFANDIVKSKLKKIEENCNRLNVKNVKLLNFDASIYKEEYKEQFDYILCDVICSGIGVMDRKPEIKLFRSQETIDEIIELQRKIFDNAVEYLKDKGEIVYSTCSVLKCENEENVKYFLEKHKNLKIKDVEFLGKSEKFIKLLPEKQKHNGFFIIKFIKEN